MLKRRIVFLSVVIALVLSLSIIPGLAASAFPDVPGHWAEAEIEFLADLGIVSGYPDGTFGTNRPISRAEVATIISNEMGLTAQAANYPDVSANHWANGTIGAVTAANIMGGYPDGEFKPGNPMTRAEIAKVLDIAYQLSATSIPPAFSDVGTGHWAYLHIKALVGNHITVGYPDGTYKPSNSMTRAEFAVFMARVLEENFRMPIYLTNRAHLVIESLQDEDMAEFQTYVHPNMGVRFSPYEYVENTHLVFTAAAIPGLLNDNTVYTWGTEDGSGFYIEKTPQEYFDRYVNRKDFTNPDDIQYNNYIQRGSLINNISVFYPDAIFVEFHVEGTDPQFGGMDWGSLFIVFEEYNGEWYVIAVVNGEWTI